MNQIEFINHVKPFKDKMFRLAKRLLVSTEEAEDATQEVLVKLWNKISVTLFLPRRDGTLQGSVKAVECGGLENLNFYFSVLLLHTKISKGLPLLLWLYG